MVAMELASVGEGTKFDMRVTVKYKKNFWPTLRLVVIYRIGGRVGDCEQAQERDTRLDADTQATDGIRNSRPYGVILSPRSWSVVVRLFPFTVHSSHAPTIIRQKNW